MVSMLMLAVEMPTVQFMILSNSKLVIKFAHVVQFFFINKIYADKSVVYLKMILGVVARCWGCIFPSLCTYHSRTYPLGEGGHAHDAI